MVGIQENHASWTYWNEHIQYLIDRNENVQKIREKLRKKRVKRLYKNTKNRFR